MNKKDDLHWREEMYEVIHSQLPSWAPFAATFARDLCETYGPQRAESKAPQELLDFMFLNVNEIAADFHKLIQREL